MATPDRVSYWNKTRNLMLVMLGLWIFFGYVVHMFVGPLNNIVIPILGFRLGFYMASQGSLIAFVIVYFTVFAAGTIYILKLMAHAPKAGEPRPAEQPIRSAGITPAPAVERRGGESDPSPDEEAR